MIINFKEKTFFLIFIAILGAFFTISKYNVFNANLLFEVWLILYCISKASLKNKNIFFASIFLTYLLIGWILADPIENKNLSDFIVIYKSFFYFILLLFLRTDSISSESYNKLFHIICYAFLIKYTTYFLFNFQDLAILPRPAIFTENNLELGFLLILLANYIRINNQISPQHLTYIILIILISGSRSAILSLFVLLVITYIKPNRKILIKLFFISAFSVAAFIMFLSRSGGLNIEELDRFMFLKYFMDEIDTWTFDNFIFGSYPITALSDYNCKLLLYSETLRSSTGNCYSVVFHSYWLRVVYDHGMFGLISQLLIYFYLIRYAPKKFQLVGFLIILINGISVSAFNNIYLMSGIALVISTMPKNTRKIHNKSLS
ncbi:hypothetical protein SAMN05660964_02301 [Thiothrix caldifontis]|uniref:O-antigen ligase like membrane protein n=1 Tax=Thiothrix caldifontis TaxID=525918 RepID=A0A1H4DM61_9GAMM|nr:hypothetical protein SAMN05660964_02301 [Thiothrix caldifontis]